MLASDKQDSTGKQGMGRSESIWNELKEALQQCFINIINTEKGKEIFGVYSHAGYAIATDADYDGARAALKAVSE